MFWIYAVQFHIETRSLNLICLLYLVIFLFKLIIFLSKLFHFIFDCKLVSITSAFVTKVVFNRYHVEQDAVHYNIIEFFKGRDLRVGLRELNLHFMFINIISEWQVRIKRGWVKNPIENSDLKSYQKSALDTSTYCLGNFFLLILHSVWRK